MVSPTCHIRTLKAARCCRVEFLEQRELLAVYVVDNLGDANVVAAGMAPGTLRQALFDANQTAAADSIEFAPGLAGTLVLEFGVLEILGDLAIQGPGSSQLTIDASGNDPTPGLSDGQGTGVVRILDSGFLPASIDIQGLTLTGGDTSFRGGGILSEDDLALSDVVINDNYATNNGGGIWTSERLELYNVVISNNQSQAFGGGFYAENNSVIIQDSLLSDNDSHVSGGGMFLDGVLVTATDSQILNNDTGVLGDGGGVFVQDGQLNMTDTVVTGNSTFGNGAGVYALRSNATLRDNRIEDNTITFSGDGAGIYLLGFVSSGNQFLMENSILSGNQGATKGGGLYARFTSTTFRDTEISGNHASSQGGGAYVHDHNLTVERSLISNNEAAGGAGLVNDGGSGFSVSESTISHNVATGGGGGLLSTGVFSTTIEKSLLTGNQAFTGGGASFVGGSVARVTDSTVSDNHAQYGGGGLAVRQMRLEVRQSTITANSADSDLNGFGRGGGIEQDSNAELNLRGSIVAGNVDPTTTGTDLFLTSPANPFDFSAWFNVIGDNTGTLLAETLPGATDAFSNQVGGPIGGLLDPLLSALQDHGGPTLTHLPQSGSPAIDHGDTAIVSDPTDFDQRDSPYLRLYAGRIDVGAVETQPHPADFDSSSLTSGKDFLTWQRNFGTQSGAEFSEGDANGDGAVDEIDLQIWETAFGTSEVTGNLSTAPFLVFLTNGTQPNSSQRLPAGSTAPSAQPIAIAIPFEFPSPNDLALQGNHRLTDDALSEDTQQDNFDSSSPRDIAFSEWPLRTDIALDVFYSQTA